MPRRKTEGYRIRGPYRKRSRWVLDIIDPAGRRSLEPFGTEREARDFARVLMEKAANLVTTDEAIEKYLQHLRDRGNKEGSIVTATYRLDGWLDGWRPVKHVTPAMLEAKYCARAREVKADTHRNELRQIKAFFSWCKRQRWISRSPAENIEPTGRRSAGKTQLTRTEASAFFSRAMGLARKGDVKALAVATVLIAGCRSSELRERVVRDLDGDVLVIPGGKTEHARRRIDLTHELAELLARHCEGKKPSDRIFASDWSKKKERENCQMSATWLRDAAREVCDSSEVVRVTPHGLRGSHATLSVEAGNTAEMVARHLGQAGPEVTRRHYIAEGTEQKAQQRGFLRVVVSNG
jgi:integrase